MNYAPDLVIRAAHRKLAEYWPGNIAVNIERPEPAEKPARWRIRVREIKSGHSSIQPNLEHIAWFEFNEHGRLVAKQVPTGLIPKRLRPMSPRTIERRKHLPLIRAAQNCVRLALERLTQPTIDAEGLNYVAHHLFAAEINFVMTKYPPRKRRTTRLFAALRRETINLARRLAGLTPQKLWGTNVRAALQGMLAENPKFAACTLWKKSGRAFERIMTMGRIPLRCTHDPNRLPLQTGVVGKVGASGAPFLVHKELHWHVFYFSPRFARKNGFVALVSVPIFDLESHTPVVLGVLNCHLVQPIDEKDDTILIEAALRAASRLGRTIRHSRVA